jgi:hypothetical protein
MIFHHIGFTVQDITHARKRLEEENWNLETDFTFMGEKIVFLKKESIQVELIETNEESYTPNNHLAFEVLDLDHYMMNQALSVIEGPYSLQNGWRIAFFQVLNQTIELIETAKGELRL